jgi:hypothetical protein
MWHANADGIGMPVWTWNFNCMQDPGRGDTLFYLDRGEVEYSARNCWRRMLSGWPIMEF